MANFTTADIKRLREQTGAGMMDVKRALEEAAGNFESAVEALRIKGAARAARRGADRTAGNGLVAAADGAMIELNCETDFVAKNEQFQQLAADIAAHAAASRPADVEALLDLTLADGRTVRENIDSVAGVVGEKLQLSRVAVLGEPVATYMHRRDPDLPPQVGVLVEFEGDSLELARAAAMQIAAMRPQYVSRGEVPSDLVDNERRIADATAREEGKPERALPKIIEGRVNGFFKDVVLLEQPSVQDSKRTVKQLLDEGGVQVRRFARFEVGQS